MVRTIRRALAATAITASLVTMSAPATAAPLPTGTIICIDIFFDVNGTVIVQIVCIPK